MSNMIINYVIKYEGNNMFENLKFTNPKPLKLNLINSDAGEEIFEAILEAQTRQGGNVTYYRYTEKNNACKVLEESACELYVEKDRVSVPQSEWSKYPDALDCNLMVVTR